jgi:hypothetical protein
MGKFIEPPLVTVTLTITKVEPVGGSMGAGTLNTFVLSTELASISNGGAVTQSPKLL